MLTSQLFPSFIKNSNSWFILFLATQISFPTATTRVRWLSSIGPSVPDLITPNDLLPPNKATCPHCHTPDVVLTSHCITLEASGSSFPLSDHEYLTTGHAVQPPAAPAPPARHTGPSQHSAPSFRFLGPLRMSRSRGMPPHCSPSPSFSSSVTPVNLPPRALTAAGGNLTCETTGFAERSGREPRVDSAATAAMPVPFPSLPFFLRPSLVPGMRPGISKAGMSSDWSCPSGSCGLTTYLLSISSSRQLIEAGFLNKPLPRWSLWLFLPRLQFDIPGLCISVVMMFLTVIIIMPRMLLKLGLHISFGTVHLSA